ncbi:MAG: tetratricopeptide repeat protein [Oligoflexus sp.]
MKLPFGFSFSILAIIFASACRSTPKAPEIPKMQADRQSQAAEAAAPEVKEQPAPQAKKQDQTHLLQGHRFAQDGLYREAIREYQLFLHQKNNHPEALRALGIVQVKTGQYTDAIKSLEVARQHFRDDFEANFYLAESYRTQDRFDDAIFYYRIALKQKPDHIPTMKALAWSYYQIRYYRASFDIARHLKKAAPNDVQVDIILGRVLNRMGRSDQALNIIRKSIVLSNQAEQPFLRSVLGDILESMGDCTQAENVYREALKDQPLLAGALLGLAKCMIQKGQEIETARDFIERALRLKPKLTEAIFWLAKSYEGSQPEKAGRYFSLFQSRAAGDPAFSEKLEISRQKLSQIRSKTAPSASGTSSGRKATMF